MTTTDTSAPNIVVQPEKFMLIVSVNEDCNVQVTNVGFNPVIFRVLTTGQDRYLVRHTKGYIKGNESAQFTISLNRQHLFDNCPPDTKVLKDDFRVECVYVRPEDVIDAKLSNIPQIIKDRKAANKNSVARKMLRCHVMLESGEGNKNTSDSSNNNAANANRNNDVLTKTREENMNALAAQNANRNANSGSGGGAMGTSNSKMTAQELEQNTLEQQRKRKTQHKSGFINSFRLMIIIALVVAMTAAWYYGSNESN